MSNGAKVIAHGKEHPSARGTYQSPEAREAAKAVASAFDDAPPEVAKVGTIGDEGVPRVAVDMTKENELVQVRPRMTIARTRIGREWYSFTENKVCLVPKHVERLLQEKNLI